MIVIVSRLYCEVSMQVIKRADRYVSVRPSVWVAQSWAAQTGPGYTADCDSGRNYSCSNTTQSAVTQQ